ncbi:MAG TPA: SLC13 family permease [Stellaceae bacterium]|nr:SLC13 family permease [Stellaceae bacterium]
MTVQWRTFVVIIAFAVYGLILLLPSFADLSSSGQAVLAIAAAGTVLWISEAIPVGATGLIVLALLGCNRGVRAADPFAGFASEVTVFLIGIAGISTGVEVSGLAERAARMLLGAARGNPHRLYWQMIASFPVMALLLPSAITRNAILIPAYETAIDVLQIDRGGQLKRAVMLTLGMLNPLASSALLTGGITAIAAGSLLGGFSWLGWFCLMAPPYYALMLGGAVVVNVMTGIPRSGAHVNNPGKVERLSPTEVRTLFVLAGTCVLWLTDSIHKLSPAVPALIGAIALQLPWIGVATWKEFEARLSWNLILTVAGSLSLAAAMTNTGTAAWLGQQFVAQFPSMAAHSVLLILTLIAASAVVHLAITNLAACIGLLIPVAVTVAQTTQLNPTVCGLIVTLTINTVVLYPAQTASNLLAYNSCHFSAADVRRLGLAMFALNIIIVLCAIPYWNLLGLPLDAEAG